MLRSYRQMSASRMMIGIGIPIIHNMMERMIFSFFGLEIQRSGAR